MGTVLITGGTGVLGSRLVTDVLARGHTVRVLSRSARPSVPAGVEAAEGDVRTDVGLAAAVEGVDFVVHAATSPFRRLRATEVGGTTNMLAAATAAGVGHFVYVSIVGVNDHRLPYYKAKWAAEQVVEHGNCPWTIQRITQFHDLIDQMLSFPVSIRTPNLAFQPIAVEDASRRIADHIEAGPAGRAGDVGGPQVLDMRQLRDERRAATGRRTFLVPLPAIGPGRAFDEGRHLTPDHPFGTTTWSEWLERRTD